VKKGVQNGQKGVQNGHFDHFIDPFWETHRTFLGATFGKDVRFWQNGLPKTTFFDEKVVKPESSDQLH
jgi:hypothetical protein